MLEIAKQAVKKAGEYLKHSFGKRKELSKKTDNEKDRSDLVSECDIKSNEIIIDSLLTSSLDKMPGDPLFIYSEESGFLIGSKLPEGIHQEAIAEGDFYSAKGYKYVIDPICGSIPFARGVADFIISIALLENQTIIGGVVYDPIHDEMFYASQGEGAFLNGEKIEPSQTVKLEEAYISIEHRVFRLAPAEELKELVKGIQKIRVAGTCALEMAYVACGRLDGVIKLNQPLYDYGAGLMVVKEALGEGGGVFKIPSFKEVSTKAHPDKLSFICTNRLIKEELIGWIKDWEYEKE